LSVDFIQPIDDLRIDTILWRSRSVIFEKTLAWFLPLQVQRSLHLRTDLLILLQQQDFGRT
jgi:hypothetical protein